MPPEHSFWFGHQGYEYLDLGRFWQIALFLGILFWLVLMLRAMVPALRKDGDKNLVALLCVSVIAIGLFYGSGLFYGERTPISIMEYWRWWVVHLWVERSEEHTSELQSLMRNSYSVFSLKKKKTNKTNCTKTTIK